MLPTPSPTPDPYADLTIEALAARSYGGGQLDIGEPFRVYAAGDKPPVTCSESWSAGVQSRYTVVEFPANPNVLSVSFKPGGAYPFLRLPLSELQDQVIPLDALWGSFAAEMRGRLYDVPAAVERIALLERLLLARLCEQPPGWDALQFAAAGS